MYLSNKMVLQKISEDPFCKSFYSNLHNLLESNTKQRLLKSYDELLNAKYKVTLNKKTIQRVKNYFQ